MANQQYAGAALGAPLYPQHGAAARWVPRVSFGVVVPVTGIRFAGETEAGEPRPTPAMAMAGGLVATAPDNRLANPAFGHPPKFVRNGPAILTISLLLLVAKHALTVPALVTRQQATGTLLRQSATSIRITIM